MSEPSSQYITTEVLNYNVPTATRLGDVISNVLKQIMLGWSEEQVYETSEKHVRHIFNLLTEKFDELAKAGYEPSFKIEDDNGTYFYSNFPGKEKPILEKIMNESPEKFELLCGKILEKLGAKTEVVGGSYDGGVDFIAYELPIGAIKFRTRMANQLLVIGQAKRYKHDNLISEKCLREFVGAAIKKRYDLLLGGKYNTKYIQPTVYAFWTTSDFDKNAKEYASLSGLWLLSGIGVAQLIIELDLETSI